MFSLTNLLCFTTFATNFISTHTSREGKRTAESSLSDYGCEKRLCGGAENCSFQASDSDLTTIDPELLSSTVPDNLLSSITSAGDRGRSIKEELQAALIATQRVRAGLQGCSCSSLQPALVAEGNSRAREQGSRERAERDGNPEDTWTRDGYIFVKKGDFLQLSFVLYYTTPAQALPSHDIACSRYQT